VPRENFTCLTRLDHERLRGLLAVYINEARLATGLETDAPPTRARDIQGIAIWGNHSTTQVPHIDVATVNIAGKTVSALEILRGHPHNKDRQGAALDSLIDRVQGRGGEIIKFQGASSGFSAADAISKHLRDWLGTGDCCGPSDIFSVGISSDENPYNVPKGLIFSFPCRRIGRGIVEIVPGLPLSETVMEPMVAATTAELCQERTMSQSIATGDAAAAPGGESKL
jgi:malate dehydrogenase